jgi:hypothetical protein
MKAVEFCYWLQGLFEVGEPTSLSEKQTDLIKRHLNMVFVHDIDPSYPEGQQAKLKELHAPNSHLKPFPTIPGQPVARC